MPNDSAFSVVKISEAYLARIRAEGHDDLGQPALRLTARGGEPLRDRFRRASAGEPILLASFSPPGLCGAYREFGPIFVHSEAGEAEESSIFSGNPDGAAAYFRTSLALRAYGVDGGIEDAVLVPLARVVATIRELLDRTSTAFVDARFPAYGCYAARFRR